MCNAVQSFHWTSREFNDRELSLHTEIVLVLQGDLREKILFAVSQCIYISHSLHCLVKCHPRGIKKKPKPKPNQPTNAGNGTLLYYVSLFLKQMHK